MTLPIDIRAAIATTINRFIEHFKSGDAAGMADLYTQEGQVLPPNNNFITGHQAIQAFWQSLMDMGIKEAQLEIVEVESYNDTAIEVSKFTLLDEQGQVLNKGKYIVIWKQIQGRWKLHRDIFNSSLPAPA